MLRYRLNKARRSPRYLFEGLTPRSPPQPPATPSREKMPRAVFATEAQARKALTALSTAKAQLEDGGTLDEALEKNHLTTGPTSSRSTLQRWAQIPTPTIQKSRSGFYLKVRPLTNLTFFENEENVLADRVVDVAKSQGYMAHEDVVREAVKLRDEVLEDCMFSTTRTRLRTCKFTSKWIGRFVARHKEKLANNMSRPVDAVRCKAFNAFNIGQFFAQVNLLYDTLSIKKPCQVCNLDETGFSPGRDIVGMSGKRVITQQGIRAVCQMPSFKYQHRITVLACVFADGSPIAPAVVFRGEREPLLTSPTISRKASEVVKDPWLLFWRKDVASVDTGIFRRWIDNFIPLARAHVHSSEWIILYYDALRSHMSAGVVHKLAESKIAVMALPAHTSDRLQPLDVSVFSAFKHWTNKRIDERISHYATRFVGDKRFGGLDIWECILEGYNAALSSSNVVSGFAKSGLWPLDPAVVCKNGIRATNNDATVVTPHALNTDIRRYLLDFKRHGPPDLRVRGGFICTERGIELTRPDVRSELRLLELDREQRRKEKEEMVARREKEDGTVRAEKRRRKEHIEFSKALDRVRRHGVPFALPRSLAERRKLARERAMARRYSSALAVREGNDVRRSASMSAHTQVRQSQ